MRKKLEDGITLPNNVNLTVYKSEKDDSADPLSAVLLYKGIHLSNQQNIVVNIVNSNLHVFTRLQGRNNYTSNDKQNQYNVFTEILASL
jgi:carboxylesterase